MTDAVQAVQAAAIVALETHPALAQALTGVFDGPPPRAAYPYIAVADGLSTDWSTKTTTGREIRLALTIWDDGEEASRLHNLMGHAEEAIAAMARDLPGWHVSSNVFLRSFIARDPAGPWAGLVEYRIRVMKSGL
jgi:Protein of unknown function (DUF3168)